jgi:vacuolar-type H+-ATPase subunit I/STV1
MTKPEELQQEIVENARSDRKRLVQIADGLKKFADRGQVQAEGDGEGMDPEVALALSEQVAKVSDSLTKINQQLVELVRINARRIPSAEEIAKFNAKEKDSVYDEMEAERKRRMDS